VGPEVNRAVGSANFSTMVYSFVHSLVEVVVFVREELKVMVVIVLLYGVFVASVL
jgi:hypothetical protein